ncbi:hypothetical protein NUW58_g8886 [Xylaria curta]|uniref:Uncharacterized protein n=1 Tax=Xylaria curta TaxID=42375 RepID=A0ACC1N2Y9_9PEZI|nr:hypothetical protein NUW58_g8886 [Xylaria curta]
MHSLRSFPLLAAFAQALSTAVQQPLVPSREGSGLPAIDLSTSRRAVTTKDQDPVVARERASENHRRRMAEREYFLLPTKDFHLYKKNGVLVETKCLTNSTDNVIQARKKSAAITLPALRT